MKFSTTRRGFALIKFQDRYDTECSIQKSSLMGEDAIWFGVASANPQILASDAIRMGLKPVEGGEKDNGWVPFSVPREVSFDTRMHLTVEQVKELLPILQRFVETGEVEMVNTDESSV